MTTSTRGWLRTKSGPPTLAPARTLLCQSEFQKLRKLISSIERINLLPDYNSQYTENKDWIDIELNIIQVENFQLVRSVCPDYNSHITLETLCFCYSQCNGNFQRQVLNWIWNSVWFISSKTGEQCSAEKEKTQTVTRTPAHISFLREYGKVSMYLGISGLWDNWLISETKEKYKRTHNSHEGSSQQNKIGKFPVTNRYG